MVRKFDEFFCHQVVSTFDTPGTSAREWTERAWTVLHEKDGAAQFAAGFGYYPNRNIIDAFACFTIGDKTQLMVRASRELRPDIDSTTVGPFAYECTEPLNKVRFRLDENEHGLSYDIEITGTSPIVQEPAQRQLSRGRVKEDIIRLLQPVLATGWIKAEGQTFTLDHASWRGLRDRSWGVRMAGADMVETGVQPRETYAGQLSDFALVQFKDWGAQYHTREIWDDKAGFIRRWHLGGNIFYPYGSGQAPLEVQNVAHHYEFDNSRPEQQRRCAGGRVVLTAIDGSQKEITIHPISICYQGPAGYGLPYKGFIHGLWMGSFWMDGHRFDLTDPQVMRTIWGYVDYACEFRCGYDVGWGTLELMVVGKYPRYGFLESYRQYGSDQRDE